MLPKQFKTVWVPTTGSAVEWIDLYLPFLINVTLHLTCFWISLSPYPIIVFTSALFRTTNFHLHARRNRLFISIMHVTLLRLLGWLVFPWQPKTNGWEVRSKNLRAHVFLSFVAFLDNRLLSPATQARKKKTNAEKTVGLTVVVGPFVCVSIPSIIA